MKSNWVDLGGPVHYVDFGGDGRPMVMVHGLGGSFMEWTTLAPLLTRHFRVLAPDMIGFGRTPLAGRHATLDANQELIESFIREVVGGPAILVGHSMGGMLAMLEAGRHPESVTELVLIDPAMPPAGRETMPIIPPVVMNWLGAHPRMGNALGMLVGRSLGVRRLVDDAIRRAVADFDAFDPDLFERLVEFETQRMRSGLPYVGWIEARESLGERYRGVKRFDREVVAPISAPTLMIYGSEDKIIQRTAFERVAKQRGGWSIELLQGLGHDPNMEAPDVVARLMLQHLEVAAA